MTKLLRHMEAMQAVSTDRLSSPNSHRADSDFIGSITEMLDGPAQREAQFDFLSLSARTVSGEFHGQYVPMQALRDALSSFMWAGERLDVIKKLIFYGEDAAKGRAAIAHRPHSDQRNANEVPAIIAQLDHDDGPMCGPDEAELILHAVLGVATEASEMIEALYKAVFEGHDLDLTNLLEESGDTKWYLAILARVMGVDWDEDERRIIAKLKKRYADKFDSKQANNRDLSAERRILERPADTVTIDLKVNVAEIPAIAPVFDLVRDCGEKFRSYEAHHRAKGTPESMAKAEVNNELAERCEKTLELFA